MHCCIEVGIEDTIQIQKSTFHNCPNVAAKYNINKQKANYITNKT